MNSHPTRSSGGTFKIGALLPSVNQLGEQGLDLTTAARHAEEVGLDSIWHGDHLAVGMPTLDAPIALATAAAVTERIGIGASVFIPAIRPLAWAAKQVMTLQYLSGGRLLLGVGSGGGEAQWAAAGVPYAERGRRTDTALRLLPALLDGSSVQLADEPGQPEVGLELKVAMPPVWVGNASGVAIRRAARFGQGWFPSLITADDVAAGAGRLTELAHEYDRPAPSITIGISAALGSGADIRSRESIAADISRFYGKPLSAAMSIPIMGSPAEAAEQLAPYREAGAEHVVAGISEGDWRQQCDLLAEIRRLLN